MPIADRKKANAAIFKYGKLAQEVEERVTEMERIRALYISQSVDPTGTALDGTESTVGTAVTALRTEMDKAVWTALKAEALRIWTHGGAAIEVDA